MIPNAFEDFGDEGDPMVVGDDDDADDTRWLRFIDWLSKDSTRAEVDKFDEFCRLLTVSFFSSTLSLVPS